MKKVCRICGKEYEACKNQSTGIFRWRDIACCVEHGMEYFDKVEAGRRQAEEVVSEEVEIEVEEIDGEFEEADDDEDTIPQ